MAHTFTKHHFHIVFGTKQRQKLIAKEIRPQLWSYIAGICRNKGILALAIGGIEDHVHLLVELKPDMTVPKAVNLIKSNSSRWMKRKDNRFSWQEGYSSFSVSASTIPVVKRYVLNQEVHHRKRSYQDELFSLLQTRDRVRSRSCVRLVSVPPLRGSSLLFHAFPGLTAWATTMTLPAGAQTNCAV